MHLDAWMILDGLRVEPLPLTRSMGTIAAACVTRLQGISGQFLAVWLGSALLHPAMLGQGSTHRTFPTQCRLLARCSTNLGFLTGEMAYVSFAKKLIPLIGWVKSLFCGQLEIKVCMSFPSLSRRLDR